jgi:hypothetical protein
MSATSRENERACICVLGVSILPLILRFVDSILDLFHSVFFNLFIRFTLLPDTVRVTCGVD